MRTILFLIASLFLLGETSAQQPEKVYGYAKVQHPLSWYRQQSAAWKKVIDENPKNNNAWYNYYYANRILLFRDTTDKRSRDERIAGMNKLLDDMSAAIPDSYEANLCRWQNGGMNMAMLPYLKRAVAIDDSRREHIDDMINMGEYDRNIAQRDQYSKRKMESDMLSTGMMYYNYNVMTGTAPNAIIVTAGDNDTYPVWALQALGIRKDITVINIYLIQLEDYRAKLFKELGVEPWQPKTDPSDPLADARLFEKELIKRLAANKKKYPVYIALTAAGCTEYTAPVEENLYLTGLTYEYSTEAVDNMALMKRNFEQQYTLDYIEHPFYKDISASLVTEINRNYAVPMLKLYDHYKTSGDLQREAHIRRLLVAISKNTPEEQEIQKHLNKQ